MTTHTAACPVWCEVHVGDERVAGIVFAVADGAVTVAAVQAVTEPARIDLRFEARGLAPAAPTIHLISEEARQIGSALLNYAEAVGD